METKVIINGSIIMKRVDEEVLVSIMETGGVYQSVQARYHLLMSQLKGRSVRFKDHTTYLMNLAKEAGLWETEDDLHRAKVLDLTWYHSLQLFLGWVKRNYANSYDKLTAKAGTPARQEKAKETKSTVVRQKKLTKKRLESAGSDADSKKALMDYITENLQDIIEALVSDKESKRILVDALEANGLV